jgi:hypothetical protein
VLNPAIGALIIAGCWLSGLLVAGWSRLVPIKGLLVGHFLKEHDLVRLVLGESLFFTCLTQDGAYVLFCNCCCRSAGTDT